MRTGRIRRATAAALLSCGLAVGGFAATAAAAPAHDDGHGNRWDHSDHWDHHGRDGVWGTVTSRIELNVRDNPSLNAGVVVSLSPGSQDRIECRTWGSDVNGTSWWYWLSGARGWASAAYLQADGDVSPC
ncbi:SH3 domain-containing protein [Streptomyces sp. NPDC059070]|uniref:SH3 domain-containing protein n=1 Tax=unclassified Streptomyces TaxID=2593676 RepID=UPI0034E25E0D